MSDSPQQEFQVLETSDANTIVKMKHRKWMQMAMLEMQMLDVKVDAGYAVAGSEWRQWTCRHWLQRAKLKMLAIESVKVFNVHSVIS